MVQLWRANAAAKTVDEQKNCNAKVSGLAKLLCWYGANVVQHLLAELAMVFSEVMRFNTELDSAPKT